jgi:hypothetical protein
VPHFSLEPWRPGIARWRECPSGTLRKAGALAIGSVVGILFPIFLAPSPPLTSNSETRQCRTPVELYSVRPYRPSVRTPERSGARTPGRSGVRSPVSSEAWMPGRQSAYLIGWDWFSQLRSAFKAQRRVRGKCPRAGPEKEINSRTAPRARPNLLEFGRPVVQAPERSCVPTLWCIPPSVSTFCTSSEAPRTACRRAVSRSDRACGL